MTDSSQLPRMRCVYAIAGMVQHSLPQMAEKPTLGMTMFGVTTPDAFNPEEARQMAQAGADIVVAHMGLTMKGAIGAKTAKTLDDSVRLVKEIADAAKSACGDVLVLCHGGPLAMPDDAQYVLDRVPKCDGFFGASSMERLPTEVAITSQTRDFKSLRLRCGK